MSKFWHIMATVGMAALAAAIPEARAVIASHGIVSSVLLGAWAVLGNLVQSPITPKL